ncbi:MAG: hypothetical protein ABIV36_18050 [Sphingobium limneticum]
MTDSTTPAQDLRSALEPILMAIAKSGKVEEMDWHHITAALAAPATDEPVAAEGEASTDDALYRKLRQKLSRVHPSNQSPNLTLRIELSYGEIARLSAVLIRLAHPPAAEPVGLREKAARIIAAGYIGDPWWWKEAFDDGQDETAARLRADDEATAAAVIDFLATPARTDDAAEERDALLSALGWKTGPFPNEGVRKVVLEDSAGLRPEMVKARRRADDAEADRDLWRFIAGERVEDARSGLLIRIWNQMKDERKRRIKAEAALASAVGET